ncbi:hypothetical protein TSOC_008133, partial [Tetrabaena socialis]
MDDVDEGEADEGGDYDEGEAGEGEAEGEAVGEAEEVAYGPMPTGAMQRKRGRLQADNSPEVITGPDAVELPMPTEYQQTLWASFTVNGVGLHTGERACVRVRPAFAGEGRYFVRVPDGTNIGLVGFRGPRGEQAEQGEQGEQGEQEEELDENDSDAPVKSARGPRGRGAKAAASAGAHHARWCGPLAAQLEQALSFLAAVLGLVRLAPEALIPLVRQCLHGLTVDPLRTLHYPALGLVVSVFRHHPRQRNTVVDELIQGVVSYLPPGKHAPRHYPLQDTMRALVTKICSEIWFLPKFQIEDEVEVADVSRRPEQRAAQLGEVVMAVYGTMQGITSLPLHAAVPIVVTIRSIVGEEGRHESEAVRSGAKEVADALLARALELQGQQDQGAEPPGSAGPQQAPPPPDELFQCLLSLHVLCLADPRLLHRPADPQRVVRCLAPYVKELPPNATGPVSRRKAERLLAVLAALRSFDPSAERLLAVPAIPDRMASFDPSAERLLAVLAILDSCMWGLRHLDDLLAAEMVADLRHLIRNISHAVGVAIQCLCSLARLKPEHRAA